MLDFIDRLINEDIPKCPRVPRLRSATNEDFVINTELDDLLSQFMKKSMGPLLGKHTKEMLCLVEGGMQEAKDYSDSENKHLYDKIDSLEKQVDGLLQSNDDLRNQVDNIGQYSRRDNFKIVGVPEEDGEDLNKIVIDIVKHTGVDLKVEDIDITHRLNTRDDAVSDTTNMRNTPKKIASIFCKVKHRSKQVEILGSKKYIREKIILLRIRKLQYTRM